MNNTFLIFKDINAEKKELIVATHDEWDAIMKANKGLPMNERRLFIKDIIDDCGQLDCMYIETTIDEYRKHHAEHSKSEYIRKINAEYFTFSIDAPIRDTNVPNMHEGISDGVDNEEIALSEIVIDKLRKELAEWRPWAEEMLDYYISGQKSTCTKDMMDKYGVTRRTIAMRKVAFESKIKDLLNKFEN